MLFVKCPIYQIQCFLCHFVLSNLTLQTLSMPLHQQYPWPSALHQTPILDGRLQLAGSNALTHSIDGNEYFDLPFIPHFSVISLTPHGNFNLRSRRDDQRCLFLKISKKPLTQRKSKDKHTFSGKKIGNQEIISLLFSSMVLGLILSSIAFLLLSSGV
jgi:hypothetical protein